MYMYMYMYVVDVVTMLCVHIPPCRTRMVRLPSTTVLTCKYSEMSSLGKACVRE